MYNQILLTNNLKKARFLNATIISDLFEAPYLVIRPTNDDDELTVTAFFDTADDYEIRIGYADRPTQLLAKFEDGDAALACLYILRSLSPGTRLWYDGIESYSELVGEPRKAIEDCIAAFGAAPPETKTAALGA